MADEAKRKLQELGNCTKARQSIHALDASVIRDSHAVYLWESHLGNTGILDIWKNLT